MNAVATSATAIRKLSNAKPLKPSNEANQAPTPGTFYVLGFCASAGKRFETRIIGLEMTPWSCA